MPPPKPFNPTEGKSFYTEQDPFSNVYTIPVEFQGVVYPTSEHAYQCAKFVVPGSDENWDIIELLLATSDITELKAIVAANRHRFRQGWDVRMKLEVMTKIVMAKMSQHEWIAQQLLNTGNEYLFEDTPADSPDDEWGVVTVGTNLVEGSNYMGRILMNVRRRLRNSLQEG
jgi:ribA/ribD-fused uncharacterized protein